MEYRYPKLIQDQIDAIDKQILDLMKAKEELIRNSAPRTIFKKDILANFPAHKYIVERFMADMQKGN